MVGFMKPASCVVELKTSLTMELLNKPTDGVVTPIMYILLYRREEAYPFFVRGILEKEKIGIIEVLSPQIWRTSYCPKSHESRIPA